MYNYFAEYHGKAKKYVISRINYSGTLWPCRTIIFIEGISNYSFSIFNIIGRGRIIEFIDKRSKMNREEYITKQQEDLLNYWENEWVEISNKEPNDYDSYFLELFKRTYQYVLRKEKENKKKNFLWKKIFLGTVVAVIIIFLVFVFYNYFYLQKTEDFDWMIFGIAVLAILFLFAGIIAKWMDVKKYQETWARHSMHKFYLKQEMMKFIYQLPPYHGTRRKEIFIRHTLKIWKNNQLEFYRNMTNKEKDLKDLIPDIKFLNK